MNLSTLLLVSLDTDLLLNINGTRALWADYFMYAFSGKIIWVPMYLSIFYVLCKNLPWKVALGCIITITLVITFADQVSATLIRPYVERLRPSNLENPISAQIQIVNGYRGGRYGFPSCHAANTFGLAFFVFYIFRNRVLTTFFMIWAFVTCYSRSYLGVHYPGDLLVGALIGFMGSSLCCWLFYRFAAIYFQYKRKEQFVHVYFPALVGSVTIIFILIYALISAFFLH